MLIRAGRTPHRLYVWLLKTACAGVPG